MSRHSDTLVFLPTYNERLTIGPLLDAILALPVNADVLVIDDASPDGTGRLQSVTPDRNPRFHALLSEFHAITNTPILLNTSFNLHGFPLVSEPADALDVFDRSGLRYLAIEDWLIAKVQGD